MHSSVDPSSLARALSFLLCISSSLAGVGLLDAQTPESPIDLDRAAGLFAEAQALEAGNPWPDSLVGPLLFVDPATRFAVASAPDSAGVLRTEGALFVGELPPEVGIANTAVEWAGRRWTMLIWPLPAGHYARNVLIAHELFHRIAPRLGLEMSSPANRHLETAEGRTWLRLEFRALARALAEEGENRREAVLDALRFRARRQSLFPAAEAEERALELNEGLSEYTGVRAAVGPAGRDGWAAHLVEAREVRAAGEGMSRNFAYATGAGYGLLLDRAEPGWQRAVDPAFDFARATAGAYDAGPPAHLAAEAAGRADEYDSSQLARFERERAEETERRLRAWRERFFESPVLRLPADSAFGFSFNPNRIASMEDVGQVLMGGEVRAGWGTLEVEGNVLIRREERRVVDVLMPAPADPETRPISGDGWVLRLNDGWELIPDDVTGSWTVREVDP